MGEVVLLILGLLLGFGIGSMLTRLNEETRNRPAVRAIARMIHSPVRVDFFQLIRSNDRQALIDFVSRHSR